MKYTRLRHFLSESQERILSSTTYCAYEIATRPEGYAVKIPELDLRTLDERSWLVLMQDVMNIFDVYQKAGTSHFMPDPPWGIYLYHMSTDSKV
jgi:hypothetical protein